MALHRVALDTMPLVVDPAGEGEERLTERPSYATPEHRGAPRPRGPVVLLRHGESEWNVAGRYAGWADAKLSREGRRQAAWAGELLRAIGLPIDVVHVSALARATETAHIAASYLPSQPVIRVSWRLNERHYGAMEGLTRGEAIERFGRDVVRSVSDSAGAAPPLLPERDARHPRHDSRYGHVAPDELPLGESRLDVLRRLLPYWHTAIERDVLAGHRVLVVAHDHLLRALIGYLQQETAGGVAQVPQAVPMLVATLASASLPPGEPFPEPARPVPPSSPHARSLTRSSAG